MQNRNKSFSPEEKTEKLPHYQYRILTFNIAGLPFEQLIHRGIFTLTNKERMNMICDRIISWIKADAAQALGPKDNRPPHVLSFQEAIDPEVRHILIHRLETYYPYHSARLEKEARSSGLLVLSQLPILTECFHAFKNVMKGSEKWLADKGIYSATFLAHETYYIKFFSTHLEAGNAVCKDKQADLGGTPSMRRGDQMSLMYHLVQTTRYDAPLHPEKKTPLQYLMTHVSGDLNDAYNSKRQLQSISTGKSFKNKFREGNIKYPGRFLFSSLVLFKTPNNFYEVREVTKAEKGPKITNQEQLQFAKENEFYVGTSIKESVLQQKTKSKEPLLPSDAGEYKILDVVLPIQDAPSDNFNSVILSHQLNGEGGSSNLPLISDHFAVLFTHRYQLPKEHGNHPEKNSLKIMD